MTSPSVTCTDLQYDFHTDLVKSLLPVHPHLDINYQHLCTVNFNNEKSTVIYVFVEEQTNYGN